MTIEVKVGPVFVQVYPDMAATIGSNAVFWEKKSRESKGSPMVPLINYYITVYDLMKSGF